MGIILAGQKKHGPTYYKGHFFSFISNPNPTMKTYTLVLDMLILSLLALSLHFLRTDYSITDSFVSRRGVVHTTIITWQSLFAVASFCLFLRYIA